MRFSCLVCVLLLIAAARASAELNDDEQKMVDWIDAHATQAIDLLEETTNIGSGTMNRAGVRKVGEVMQRELDALGLDTRWIDMPADMNRAGHLFARKDGMGLRFLLIGHLDTVFEADDDFRAFSRQGDRASGPGVEDMKSGNTVIVFTLGALREIGVLERTPLVVAFTGDEESAGDPIDVARKDLVDAGKWADVSLGFESAVYKDGRDWATISRRSSSSWMLEVTGQQAHSSGIFSEDVGAGAIFEASRILSRFYNDVRGEQYLTFNAGNIQGGTTVDYDSEQTRGSTFGKTNVVPQTVIVHGGIRTISQEQLEAARKRMQAIVAENLPLTSATITFRDRYPSMAPTEGNRRLADVLSQINVDLGRGPMDILDPLQRGAADISFVAPYSDSLAGMGAMGEGGHTPNESVELDSIPLAIKRAAMLMYRLSQHASSQQDPAPNES